MEICGQSSLDSFLEYFKLMIKNIWDHRWFWEISLDFSEDRFSGSPAEVYPGF